MAETWHQIRKVIAAQASTEVTEEQLREERIRTALARGDAELDAGEQRIGVAVNEIIGRFEAFARFDPLIQAAKLNEVFTHGETVQRGSSEVYLNSAQVTLRWGNKFGLTDEERDTIRQYQQNPLFRWKRGVPEKIAAEDFYRITAVVTPYDISINPTPGVASFREPQKYVRTDDFLKAPEIIDPPFADAYLHPIRELRTIERRDFNIARLRRP